MQSTDVSFHPLARHIRWEVPSDGAFVDEELRIRLSGFAPHQEVRIHATTEDDEHRRWSSDARFRTNAQGEIDLSTQESIGGTYRGVAAMGLFWSMRLAHDQASRGAGAPATFVKRDATPQAVMLRAEVDRSVAASGRMERHFHARGTAIRDVRVVGVNNLQTAPESGPAREGGRIGRLFLPPAEEPPKPLPAVLVLSGSGGGLDVDKAAVLSRHGFAALALAYFGIAPLPSWLHRVPLEYIQAAIAWLRAQPEINPHRIGVLGVSRGAELALISATRCPEIRAVVAYAPSSVAWASGGRDRTTGLAIPAWTWRGEPVPSAPLPLRRFMWRSAFRVVAMRRPVMFRNLFRSGLQNGDAVARAAIPVEQIKGPVLLISGGDDHVWPSEQMADAIVARLKERGFEHAVEHLHYASAGHSLRYPHLPTTTRTSRHEHLRGARLSFGGNARADAEAQGDSWRRSIAFLSTHLQL